MTTCFLAPDPIQSKQFIPGGIVPANGGLLFFYLAGTTTKTTVYKDNAAGASWTNPIVLDSGGDLTSGGEVWFAEGETVKVVFAPSTDTDPPISPYWTKDDLVGINDITVASSGLDWVATLTPSFVSATSLRLSGDQTAAGSADPGRRMQASVTGGTVYGVIKNATFATGSTTINLNMVDGVLDAGLSASFYGLLAATHPAAPIFGGNALCSSVVASQTTAIWVQGGDYLHVTGTTTIAHFGNALFAGATMSVITDSDVTISSTANVLTPGSGNFTSSANTTLLLRAEAVNITRVVGVSPGAGGYVPVGTVVNYLASTAPTGWVEVAGASIGSAGSGGTARANADTLSLYKLIWNNIADAQCAVATGRGASAAADFAANKALTLPDARGRVLAGYDLAGSAGLLTLLLSGVTGSTLAASGGNQQQTIVSSTMAAHTHQQSISVSNSVSGAESIKDTDGGAGASNAQPAMGIVQVENNPLPLNTQSTGGGGAHNNVQPTLITYVIAKL